MYNENINNIEKQIIGSLIMKPYLIYEINFIKPIHFQDIERRNIFSIISELMKKNQEFTIEKLALEYQKRHSVIIIPKITEIITNIITTTGIQQNAMILYEDYLKREVMKLAYRIGNDIKTKDILDLIFGIQQKLISITGEIQKESENPKQYTESVYNSLYLESENRQIKTGIEELDNLLSGGFKPQTLNIVAGRPSQGKTSFIVDLINKHKDKSILIYSLDQSTRAFATRLLINRLEKPYNELKPSRKRVENELGKMNQSRIYISEKRFTIENLLLHSIGMKHKNNIDMIIIDYIQLIYSKQNNDNQKYEYIAYELKTLAKELNIPIIALSQLNRSVEARANKYPILADLRASGGIEQAADTVIMLYYPNNYGFTEFPKSTKYGGHNAEKYIQIILNKHKDGAIGSLLAYYRKEIFKFENEDYKEIEELPF